MKTKPVSKTVDPDAVVSRALADLFDRDAKELAHHPDAKVRKFGKKLSRNAKQLRSGAGW